MADRAPMRLLVVGGTSFIGRHAVEAAVGSGHDVTVFHRGRTNPGLLAGRIEHRLGDRDARDYASLDGDETWDAVIDTSAYVPRHVHQLADALGSRAAHYVHVSSISAYDTEVITADEDSPLAGDLPDPSVEEITAETYGPLKAMSERAAGARFGADRTSVVRPTFVAGPHDSTDRFTYWTRRVADGGDVAILDTSTHLQIVDVRDLGAFLVHLAEHASPGEFDAVGPHAPIPELLAEITPADARTRFVPVADSRLTATGIRLPLLLSGPPEFQARPGTRARAAGLTTRTAAETAEATRAWDDHRGRPPLAVGPSAEDERRLLAEV